MERGGQEKKRKGESEEEKWEDRIGERRGEMRG